MHIHLVNPYNCGAADGWAVETSEISKLVWGKMFRRYSLLRTTVDEKSPMRRACHTDEL